MSRYPLFMVPWYYRTFPRYYHMCRYPLSYHSAVLSYEPVSSLLRFRGIIGHFRGIIICAVILFLIIPRYYHMSQYPLFKLPWYYRTLPRYYHMCRYLLSYASAVLSHVLISSILGFRSNSPFSSGWSQSSLL